MQRLLAISMLLTGCASAGTGPASAPAPGATPSMAPSMAPSAAASAAPVVVDESRRPPGPPEGAQAAFGAIEGKWRAEGETVALYGTMEPTFAGKVPGTTTSYYVQVGGVVYAVHWDQAADFDGWPVGQTVNLHPADSVACKADASHPAGTRCWRLYKVYPGSRRIAPLLPR